MGSYLSKEEDNTEEPNWSEASALPYPGTYNRTYESRDATINSEESSTAKPPVPVQSVANLKKETFSMRTLMATDNIDKCIGYRVLFSFDTLQSCVVHVFFDAKEVVDQNNCTIEISSAKRQTQIFPAGKAQSFQMGFDIPTNEGSDMGVRKLGVDRLLVICLEVTTGSTATANANIETAPRTNQNEAAAAVATTMEDVVVKRHPDISAALASLRFRGQFSYVLWSTSGGAALEYRLERQKAQFGESAYILHNLYGIKSVAENNTDSMCVVCLSAARKVAPLPCRHLCLCLQCAKRLGMQRSRCPICRCEVKSFLKI